MLRIFLTRQKGQGLVEYGLVLLLITVVVFVALATLGPRIQEMFGSVYNSLR